MTQFVCSDVENIIYKYKYQLEFRRVLDELERHTYSSEYYPDTNKYISALTIEDGDVVWGIWGIAICGCCGRILQ